MSTDKLLSGDERKALLSEFNRGAKLIFNNAEVLFQEAEVLRKNGSYARSLFLHQISMEECAKVEMIGAWATTVSGPKTSPLQPTGTEKTPRQVRHLPRGPGLPRGLEGRCSIQLSYRRDR